MPLTGQQCLICQVTWHIDGWVRLALSEIQVQEHISYVALCLFEPHFPYLLYAHGNPTLVPEQSLYWVMFQYHSQLTDSIQGPRKQSSSKSQILIGCHRAQNVTSSHPHILVKARAFWIIRVSWGRKKISHWSIHLRTRISFSSLTKLNNNKKPACVHMCICTLMCDNAGTRMLWHVWGQVTTECWPSLASWFQTGSTVHNCTLQAGWHMVSRDSAILTWEPWDWCYMH